MHVSMTGIAWYRAEDYARLRALFKDGEKLPDTYEAWLTAAQQLYDKLTAQGHAVVKAEIDPVTFAAWCRTRGMEPDAKARMAYGNECAARKCGVPIP
jgi:hypothetical protein